MYIEPIKLKKRKKIKPFILLLTVLMFFGMSLAAVHYIYYFQDKRDNTLATGLISIDYQDGNGLINLENTLPVIDDIGIENDPYVFSVKNTSVVPINLKIELLPEEDSTIHLSAVRYALYFNDNFIKKDNVASIEDNVLYVYENFQANDRIDVKLVFWVDYYYENDGDTFSARVKVTGESFDYLLPMLSDEIEKKLDTRLNTYVEDNGIKYISGAKDDIDFNYVWYSGKLWRITAIYPDGSIKMITDNAISILSYGEDENFYTNETTTSWIYQWLNEDFLDTLYNYDKIIETKAKWNVTNSNEATIDTKLSETTMVTASVGLLNSYEYYKSYEKLGDYTNGYLNIGYYWWLLNPNAISKSWSVHYEGYGMAYEPNSEAPCSVRPTVKLLSKTKILEGTGTKNDPYKLNGDIDKAIAKNTLLNARVSGEYVKFDSKMYRIVGTELIDGEFTTKLNLVDYVRDDSDVIVNLNLSSNVTYGSGTTATYWDYYLNNTWKGNISNANEIFLVKGNYYLGQVGTGISYKASICKEVSNTVTTKDCTKVSSVYNGYVGLPRVGEMFSAQLGAGQSLSSTFWLITPFSDSNNRYVAYYGNSRNVEPTSKKYAVRPSINLVSEMVITSGSGTEMDPYKVNSLSIKSYSYKNDNDYYVYTVSKTGTYKIELWGASGGYGRTNGVKKYAPGKGGYTSGEIELTEGDTLYFYIGGQGGSPSGSSQVGGAGGYNGGGKGGNDSNYDSSEAVNEAGGGGGGATDVRYFGSTTPTTEQLAWNSTLGLNSRIMVAAGGAGSAYDGAGGYGGGLTGGAGNATSATKGSQTGGNAFGVGGNGSNSYEGGPGGGGGGYYGGKAGQAEDASGAGGSSFISGHTGSVAITSSSSRTARKGTDGATCANGTTDNLCSVHYSGKVFTSTVIKAGNSSMPGANGLTTTGRSGNGYARITFLGE